jgi:hypothetical protein
MVKRKSRREEVSLCVERTKNKECKLAKEMFRYWNEKEIILHKKIEEEDLERNLSRYLKNYKECDFKQAIDNYNTILKDESYFFKYKFSLMNFFHIQKRRFEKFLNDGERWTNYLEFKSKKQINIKKDEEITINVPKVENIITTYDEGLYQKCLNMLKTIPYQEYLFSSHWKSFCGEAMKWANYKCQLCNKSNILLNVHHKSYDNKGKETFNDVIVLCCNCHKLVHGKEVC